MKHLLEISDGLSLEELMEIKGGANSDNTCQTGSVGFSCTSGVAVQCNPTESAVTCQLGSVGLVIVTPPESGDEAPAQP